MILYLLMLFYLSKEVTTQLDLRSPCPDTFYYENQTETDKWFGVITLQTLEELTGIWLTVKLDNRAELLGNWFGESFSSDNKEFRITNPDYILEAGPPVSVKFFIQYNPTTGTIPRLETIRLNGKTICSKKNDEHKNGPKLHISKPRPTALPTSAVGNSEYGTNNDRVHLSSGSSKDNTLYTGTTRPPVNTNYNPVTRPTLTGTTANEGADTNRLRPEQSNADDFFPGDFNIPNDSNSGQRFNNSKKQENQHGVSCGTVVLRPKPLISFGQDTIPGQWPWHVAIYRTKGIQLTYICGGSIISETHILTAAHCVTNSRSKAHVDPKVLLVYLGKYNLKTFGSETQDRDVEDVYIHPEFNSSTFYNDIAILKLSRPIEITDYVRPICLWEGDSNLEYVINKEGTVIGWGFDEKRSLSEKLMQAKMPIISTIQCIYSNREFFSRFTFDKNFCAGFRNGTSVCNGDSGGSMVFPKRGTSGQDTVWQIRGLVSVGVALQTEGVCDTSQYVIFTDVAKHLSWIRQIVNSGSK